MNGLVSQIRGVVGVAGVMILDRLTKKSEAVLPASFDDNFASEMKKRFLDLADKTASAATFRVKLARGWVIIKITSHYGFLILAKEDLNIGTLNLVLKSMTIALSQEIEAREEKEDLSYEKGSVLVLVKAINLIKEHFAENLSRFQLAQFLRDSKTKLMEKRPELKHFSVDPNGEVIIIKGSDLQLNQHLTETVASWLIAFKDLVKEQTLVAGFDVKSITEEIQPDLETMQFYRIYQKLSAS